MKSCNTKFVMSWEKKGKNGPYCYRSFRTDGRVRRAYVGRGKEADELAYQIQERRQERQVQREVRQRELAEVAVAEQELRDLRTLASLLIRVVLERAGFCEHRGQWRKPRHDRDRHQEPEDR